MAEFKNEEREYMGMDMKQMVESVLRDSKIQGTITYPLRTEGYHKCCNLMYTDYIK